MNTENVWHDAVPDAEQFNLEKTENFNLLAEKQIYRQEGLNLLRNLNQFGFSHKNTWLGVPVIRLPEDILLQQELIFAEKPDLVIEVGVARGGGLVFNASMQEICGIEPNVVGIDNKVYPHTMKSVVDSRYEGSIKIFEGDSTSSQILNLVGPIAMKSKKILLILDSDHSSKHVLEELNLYVPILPIGSLLIVCDTIIDELPPGTYPDRTWSNGEGPGHAIKTFMNKNTNLSFYMRNESRSLILSEVRDGFLKKISE
jgi:cephalosporin hydroxylase